MAGAGVNRTRAVAFPVLRAPRLTRPFLQVAWAFRRTGELPHTDESHVEGIDPVDEQALGGVIE